MTDAAPANQAATPPLYGIVVCEHGCASCGEEWKHVTHVDDQFPCPAVGMNRICPPCDLKERAKRAQAAAAAAKVPA